MSKLYEHPSLVVRKFNIAHSIFTDSGDRNDDDNYDVTVNAGNNSMDIFGD